MTISATNKQVETLHYLYDPLCGWCYAAEAIVEVACTLISSTFRFEMHGGGLFDNEILVESKRKYIRSNDMRIADLTEQEFGLSYFNGLLSHSATLYDSAAPITAIIAAQALDSDIGPAMLRALQYAHYRQGIQISDFANLVGVAESVGLKPKTFRTSFELNAGHATRQHISTTRELMSQVNVSGFPAFFLVSRGKQVVIPHENYYKSPDSFLQAIMAAREYTKTEAKIYT